MKVVMLTLVLLWIVSSTLGLAIAAEYRVTTTTDAEYCADVDGNVIVFQRSDAQGNPSFYWFDVANQTEHLITTDTGAPNGDAVIKTDSGLVVYRKYHGSSTWSIRLYVTSSGSDTQIVPPAYGLYLSDIDVPWVLYSVRETPPDYGNHIYAYNLITGRNTLVMGSTYQGYPCTSGGRIGGNIVVWRTGEVTVYGQPGHFPDTIFSYDLTQGTVVVPHLLWECPYINVYTNGSRVDSVWGNYVYFSWNHWDQYWSDRLYEIAANGASGTEMLFRLNTGSTEGYTRRIGNTLYWWKPQSNQIRSKPVGNYNPGYYSVYKTTITDLDPGWGFNVDISSMVWIDVRNGAPYSREVYYNDSP